MTTHEERQRLAAAINAHRPDWPASSLYTFLTKNFPDHAYQSLAVAFTHVATDPATQTPARLLEPGPWWGFTKPAGNIQPLVDGAGQCGTCGGLHHPRDEHDPPADRRTGPIPAYEKARVAAGIPRRNERRVPFASRRTSSEENPQ